MAARTRMRAAQIAGTRRVRVEEIALPQPSPRQLRFRVEGCGVSAYPDWSANGEARLLPFGEPGNEAWGTVDAVGSEVRHLRGGDRIAAFSQRGFAEYDVVEAHAAFALPEQLVGVPFPAALLGGVMDVFERARVVAGQVVGIVGIGFLGAALVQLAALSGAKVIALSRRAFSLTIAREMGAAALVQVQSVDDALARVLEETSGQLCNVVIEATGTAAALALASRLAAVQSTLVIAGRHHGQREIDMGLWNERAIDVINAHQGDRDALMTAARSAAHAMQAGSLDLSGLYTHEVPLEGLAEALDLTVRRPLGFVKAWVRP
jgi:threonine dehydrogenase-like Zn-dependent dehydrogenase